MPRIKNRIPSEVRLETERTVLTILNEEELPLLMEMAREPDTFKYIRKLRILTEPEYARFLLTKLAQIRENKGWHWAVWLKDGTERPGEETATTPAPPIFIGAVNLNPIGGTDLMQLGCQLKKAYWNLGFASELTRRIRDFGIGEAGLKTIYGVFETENQTSRRLLQKLGFAWQETREEEGIFVEIHRYPETIDSQ